VTPSERRIVDLMTASGRPLVISAKKVLRSSVVGRRFAPMLLVDQPSDYEATIDGTPVSARAAVQLMRAGIIRRVRPWRVRGRFNLTRRAAG
jgi:hypothetical protein